MKDDEKAVMGLPTYVLVAIITSTAIIAIFSMSIYNISKDTQYQNVKNEMDKILSEAENMFEYADSATMVTLNIDFPQDMKFMVFGDLPKNNALVPTTLTLNENTSNNYYFVMNNGKTTTGHTHVRFSGEQTNEISILYPGTYDLKLELVKENNGKTYVKIFH
jgi:hypothetical protein